MSTVGPSSFAARAVSLMLSTFSPGFISAPAPPSHLLVLVPVLVVTVLLVPRPAFALIARYTTTTTPTRRA